MSEYPYTVQLHKNIFYKTKANAVSLAVKIAGAVIRAVPFRILVIRFLCLLSGTALIIIRVRSWPVIARTRSITGVSLPAWRYVTSYYMQRAQDILWSWLFFEAPRELQGAIKFQCQGEFLKPLQSASGCIVLGAHYGPNLYMHCLDGNLGNVKAVISPEQITSWRSLLQHSYGPLQSYMLRYLSDSQRILDPHKSLKELLKHLKHGGITLMHCDYPGPGKASGNHRFFGIPFQPHTFPFRLSLSHGIRIFFACFEKDKTGYRLQLELCENFSSPEEGYDKYLRFVENRIRRFPFMWALLPFLPKWLHNEH